MEFRRAFRLFRFLTGAGIGGEYTAINSAIQELIPARLRGWTDLVINGSFWIGAALGAGGSLVLLDPAFIDPALGWRLAFLIGAAIGLVILLMRLWMPESPRWLMTHGRAARPTRSCAGSKRASRRRPAAAAAHGKRVRLRMRDHTPLARSRAHAVRDLSAAHAGRPSLMAAQAFFYNAIFFTYALVLTDFYRMPAERVGWYILPFAVGNILRPAAARPSVRHHRPQADDRLDLCRVRVFCWP